MTDEELYAWLDDCPADWEEVQSFDGARWIKFTVEEEEMIKASGSDGTTGLLRNTHPQ